MQYVSVFLFKDKCFSNLSIIQCLKIVNTDQFILLEVRYGPTIFRSWTKIADSLTNSIANVA